MFCLLADYLTSINQGQIFSKLAIYIILRDLTRISVTALAEAKNSPLDIFAKLSICFIILRVISQNTWTTGNYGYL